MGALEGTSDTNLREMRVSTSLSSNFHASSIPFRNSTWGPVEMPCSSSLLIPISLLRRIKNLFLSVIFDPLPLMSRYANNRFLSLSRIRTSSMTRLAHEQTRLAHEQEFARPSHQTRKPFYITSRRQINPVLRENYASESVVNDDPASFESGSDLLRTNGQIWSRPLYVLPKFYILLYEKLREEHLVP